MYDDVYNTQHGFVIPKEHIPSVEEMERYAQGDETVVSTLVEGLIGYVVNSVEWFLKVAPAARPYQEDCFSEALLALQDFVSRELGKEYTPLKLQAFAKKNSLNAIRDWLREMSIAVTVPKTTQHRRDFSLQQCKLTEGLRQTGGDVIFDEVWMKTFMDSLDNFDQDLIRMKMGGKSNRQIGENLGVTHQTVKMHLERLATLFGGEAYD